MTTTEFKLCEFYKDILKVYKKHNLSLAHEDNHGAFIVEEYKEENVRWLTGAHYALDDNYNGIDKEYNLE